ncbi:hypothetical protein ACSLOD_28625, partial [Escherichia coli]
MPHRQKYPDIREVFPLPQPENQQQLSVAPLRYVAGLIGERISQDFQRLEESVANMKANADALNRDIATIHSNIV